MKTSKSWIHLTFYNNTIGEYATAAFILIVLSVGLLISRKILSHHLKKLASKTTNPFDDFLADTISKIGSPIFVIVSFYIATFQLELNETIRSVIHHIFIISIAIQTVLLFQSITRYGVVAVYKRARPEDPSADSVSKNIANILRWAIWGLGTVFILDNLGINISALVAGIGIGGIAIAMASQAVLGDAFSAVSIFVDKPFQIGDFIIIDNMLGSVEHIGIKTTRIRSLHGELLVFSNSDLTKSRIRNYKRMETRRIAFTIGVTYQTSTEKVKKIPVLVKEICDKIQEIRLDRVHFAKFGDFSLNYEIVYYVLSPDYNIYMDKQQEINFALKDVFEREKIEFAYPTQTLFLTKETSPT